MEQLKKCDPTVFIQMVNALVARGNRIDSPERVEELMALAHKLAVETADYSAKYVADRESAP